MTSAGPVAVVIASSIEAVGVLGYLGATALLVLRAARWARDAVSPPAGPVEGSPASRSPRPLSP